MYIRCEIIEKNQKSISIRFFDKIEMKAAQITKIRSWVISYKREIAE